MLTNKRGSCVDTVDPITLAVVQNNLQSIVNEFQMTTFRCAVTPAVYERKDVCFALLDADFGTIAQGTGLLSFLGTLGPAIKNCVDRIGAGSINDGDVIIAASHVIHGCHPPDGVLFAPIFYHDCLFGYVASKVHWRDMGAKSHFPTDSRSIFEEGLQLPPVKLYKAGEYQPDIMEIIKWNSRTPDLVWADMQAQTAGCRVGQHRTVELLDKYGVENIKACIDKMYDYSEQLTRQAIDKMPDGTWSAEDFIDDNGIDLDKPLKIKVTVTVKDSDITIDFTGSAPEQKSPMNCPFITTQSCARAAVKALTTPYTLANEGSYRPVSVIAPEGGLFNCGPTAMTFLYTIPGYILLDLINKAMYPVLMEKVPACSGADGCGGGFEGIDPKTGKHYVGIPLVLIGQGGDYYADGESALSHHKIGAMRNLPAEVIESEFPLFVEEFALEQDSGGPGYHRGGLGIRVGIRLLHDTSFWSFTDRGKTPGWGVNGGKPGASNFNIVRSCMKEEFKVLKTTGIDLNKGDKVIRHGGGGAGYGDPLQRELEAVHWDVVNEYISIENAKKDYGVIIDPQKFEIDIKATNKLRCN